MRRQIHVAAIHDLSGYGKCSLTVALPILSAAGCAVSVIPTAVLSTYTGVFEGYTWRDLTEDLPAFCAHWQGIGLRFDALYSGFLASKAQLSIVADIFRRLRGDDTLVVVDPVMADNGALYSVFDEEFARGMGGLCRSADLIVPNMTEAALLLGETYRPGPHGRAEIERMLRALHKLGPRRVVLTGVSLKPGEMGAASFDAGTGETAFAFAPAQPGFYHGTGDIFASVLVGALLRGFRLSEACRTAVDFTAGSIRRTFEAGGDARGGVYFEEELPAFANRMQSRDGALNF